MSDEKKSPSGGVRRVGEKDRKARLETGGPLFPPDTPAPSAPLPPTLPEDLPGSERPLVESLTAEAAEVTPAQPDTEADALPPMDDDAAALLAELETNVEYDVEGDEVEGDDEDDTERFRRPSNHRTIHR
jgi:hypothetical protein